MTNGGGTGRGPGEAGWSGGGVGACVAVTAFALAVLHVDGAALVDPASQPISDYVTISGGYALLGVAALALAAAVGLVAVGLRGSGLADPAAPAALLLTAIGGLVAVAVFPTNGPGTDPGPVAALHRAAGAVVLVALPLAAWMIGRRAARSPHWRGWAVPLTVAGGATCTLSAAFVLSNVSIVISGSPFLTALGVLQRVLYAVVLAVLVVLGRAVRAATATARAAGELPAGAGPVTEQLGGMA